jgi:hypothetical protein
MKDGPVQGFFASLWDCRGDANALRSDGQVVSMVQLLHRAIVSQFDHSPQYDPEIDHRVLWCREVLAAARNPVPGKVPRASADLEGMAEYLLEKGIFAPGAMPRGEDGEEFQMFPP